MAKKAIRISNVVSKKKLPAVVYGLNGIMSIFNVSKVTAWRLRHGIIQDACTQNGKIIVVDVKKALKLFGLERPEELVEEVPQSSDESQGKDK